MHYSIHTYSQTRTTITPGYKVTWPKNNNLFQATATITNTQKIYVIHNQKAVKLTQREQECLALLVKGLSAKKSAKLLDISHRTVEAHLAKVKQKAHCRTQLELLSKVRKQGNS